MKKRYLKNCRTIFTSGVYLVLLSCCFSARAQQLDTSFKGNIIAGNENYLIGPGDVLDIDVTKNQTLSRAGVRVGNNGFIQLAMLDGDIQAACRTEKELSTVIAEKYKKYLLNPNVIVSVKEFNSTPIALIGAVLIPVRFQLQHPMRLLDVLILGNGPAANAGLTVEIIRNPSINICRGTGLSSENIPEEQIVTYSLNSTLKGDEQSNPFVQPGDIIKVTEADKVGEAYLIGSVKNAKAIEIKDSVTLTQALAMVGGTAEGAQTEKIKISRQVPGSLNKTEMIVNLKEINKHTRDDVLLQANDIIEVPGPSGSQKFLRDIFRSVTPMITRIPY